MSEKLVIHDKVYGDIELDGIFKELVECSEFQRLKDIIQTGTSAIEFEKMKETTRFDHSIGAYYLITRIIENIERKLEAQGIKINPEKKIIAEISMLLHDIGHGVYSHTLEKITGYSHEKRGIDIVKDKETNIHKILVKYYGEEFASKVAFFLEKVYEPKKEKVSVRVRSNVVDLQSLLISLVSNNIDADRLDYLIRDSKEAGYLVLTETDKLIESFEFVLDIDKVIVAIPEEKKRYTDMAILERARNYKEIYYCFNSVIGDHVFDSLLEELRENPDEVPENIDETIRTFLTSKRAQISTKQHMTLTQTPVNQALELIKKTTQNEKIKELCDIDKVTKSYISLNTDQKEEYIRYLLHKAIPEIPIDTKGLVDETRWVKPYKSNEHENINIITQNGIEDYGDLEQDLINLKPFKVRRVGLSPEVIRLELGISKDEFEKKYAETIKEIINMITKAKDEFELRYIVTKGCLDATNIKEKLEQRYEIIDDAKYFSHDEYYDYPKNYKLLENKEALRIRKGKTFYKLREIYNFKNRRITYKKYRKDNKSSYTVRRKTEQIGDTTQLSDYLGFLEDIHIDKNGLKKVLSVDNLRYLYTININGNPIDISYNVAFYKNEFYEMFGQAGIIEIRPKDNKVCDRINLLEIQNFIESEMPEIARFSSNSNVYEIGMLDTYEKYKKGYVISEEADEYEQENPIAAQKMQEISQRAKQSEDFRWLSEIPKVQSKQYSGFEMI